jgi:phenylalanyl-tRNA synthetase alpha chain
METKQIYYEDQYKKTLKAKVVSVEMNVSMANIVLDQTIFYPEGGGQPSDQGTIKGKNGELEVQQVLIKDEEIVHIGKLTGKLNENENVECSIDWNRRYKNMRVHSAGHIINDATMSLFPDLIPADGEHGKKSYIKYEGSLDQISSPLIKERANEIINEDLPINTEFVTLNELKKRATWIPEHLPTNKPLRIMQIGAYSVIPDGGTQIKRTGEALGITEIDITKEDNYVYVNYKIITTPEILEVKEASSDLHLNTSSLDSNEIINIKNQALSQIVETKNNVELEQIRIDLFGRNGKITDLLKRIKEVSQEDRQQVGILLNETKQTLENLIVEQRNSFKESIREWFDPTIPVKNQRIGNLHPTSVVISEMIEIFKNMGFSITEGPEIESDHYNFELLNLPKDHPARSLQDVLYIEEPEVLLRSHTSSVETRSLENLKPPFRVVVAGKCYRFENVNATNNSMFYQFQGFVLQKGVSIRDLKGTLLYFAKTYFGSNREFRFRCKYYPEVEPGAGLDINCQFCGGMGCTVCKGRGWIEILGAGMIHPNILRNFEINPKEITGFAFGMGLDRIVMDRFKIKDIRSLYNGDIKYQ